MIKVRKSAEPEELAIYGYSCEAVKNVLIADNYEKCYICERYRDTDFEVEHLKSRKKNPDYENDWSNLYAACGYCNKKKGGYQRSIELSKQYELYRQDFCGCSFSKAERERQKQKQAESLS